MLIPDDFSTYCRSVPEAGTDSQSNIMPIKVTQVSVVVDRDRRVLLHVLEPLPPSIFLQNFVIALVVSRLNE